MPRSYAYQGAPIQIILHKGWYLVECYGAQGGRGRSNSELVNYHGGKGAYACGILNLQQSTTFFLYIGSQGQDGVNELNTVSSGGWNGGGNSGKDLGVNTEDPPDTSGAGGGATDIRLVRAPDGEEAEDEESLDSRIIVAAGGSGSCRDAYGAPGGDLTGYKVSAMNSEKYVPSDTTQTGGNSKGQGANGKDHTYVPSSGAGSGYYGGKAGQGASENYYQSVSSSGSSYVSGFPGCQTLANKLGSAFNYQLLSPCIANGFSSFPSFDVTSAYETGHEGNGAIRITPLQACSRCTKQHGNIILYVAVFIMNAYTE